MSGHVLERHVPRIEWVCARKGGQIGAQKATKGDAETKTWILVTRTCWQQQHNLKMLASTNRSQQLAPTANRPHTFISFAPSVSLPCPRHLPPAQLHRCSNHISSSSTFFLYCNRHFHSHLLCPSYCTPYSLLFLFFSILFSSFPPFSSFSLPQLNS